MVNETDVRRIARALFAKGLVVVPLEPTVTMVEAGFRKGLRTVPKYTRDIISAWAPHAGSKHSGEPGLVSALRQANRAGAIGLDYDPHSTTETER